MKPRIYKLYGWNHESMWWCEGGGEYGTGPTPKAAYSDWMKQKLLCALESVRKL